MNFDKFEGNKLGLEIQKLGLFQQSVFELRCESKAAVSASQKTVPNQKLNNFILWYWGIWQRLYRPEKEEIFGLRLFWKFLGTPPNRDGIFCE